MPQLIFNLRHNFMINEEKEEHIDDILKAVRAAIIEKDSVTYTGRYARLHSKEDEIFILSKNMLVKREDIPYQLGVWSFDDVAKKMMKKYRNYFNRRFLEVVRVRAKEENKA